MPTPPTDPQVSTAARVLWDYMKLGQELQKSDCVIAMGSHDLRVAEHAAQLLLYDWAPLLVCSGGLGRLTKGLWESSEAQKFAQTAMAAGVPAERILIEDLSANTGENILFSRRLLKARELEVRSVILAHKPYMERRAIATARKYWPEVHCVASSPPIPFDDYPTGQIPMDEVIHIMVGDFQRLMVYPTRGYQTADEIPEKALEAFRILVAAGYTQQMLNE